jgi:hypothetical protein
MKIRVYIVTFRRDDVLNLNLRTLWAGASHPEALEVTVISNHPEVCIEEANLRPNLRVLINQTRHTHSWGYLARDWNFAIIDAFKTWQNPEGVDWCVLAQNDVEWLAGWDQWLVQQEQFDLISQPVGDAVVALNIEAVRKVGLFDERFCSLHFHDIDFLNRAVITLGKRGSICDGHPDSKGGDWNSVGEVLIRKSASGYVDNDPSLHTRKSWLELRNLLFSKWGFRSLEEAWDRASLKHRFSQKTLPKEPLLYPFFWHGMAGVMENHLACYQRRTERIEWITKTYDSLARLPLVWGLRCWVVRRLGWEDGYERRRLLREETQRMAPHAMS